jgi:hypothetical protein
MYAPIEPLAARIKPITVRRATRAKPTSRLIDGSNLARLGTHTRSIKFSNTWRCLYAVLSGRALLRVPMSAPKLGERRPGRHQSLLSGHDDKGIKTKAMQLKCF